MTKCVLPWYNRTGWLGVKHQFTYLFPDGFHQVFFSVLIGAFSLGNATPSLTNLNSARGAAYTIFQLMDLVRTEREGQCGWKYS